MVDQLARTNPMSRPAPEPLIINELRANSHVCGYLLATGVQTRKANNGNFFLHRYAIHRRTGTAGSHIR